jgi:hypothetical protein
MDESTTLETGAGVTDHFDAEHAHMEDQICALREPLESGDLQAAAAGIAAMQALMLKHMREEERLLFPLFASRLLMVRATSVLGREHRRIEAHVQDLREAVDGGELVRARGLLEDLIGMMEEHHRRERDGLYSWADVLLGPDARGRLLIRIADYERAP